MHTSHLHMSVHLMNTLPSNLFCHSSSLLLFLPLSPPPLRQTHPNVDKALFNQRGILGLKHSGKSFPLHQDIGALKWRLQTTDESLMPLSSEATEHDNHHLKCFFPSNTRKQRVYTLS